MQQVITPITQRFMDFIARVFVPQSVFFIFFMFFDFLFSDFKHSTFFLTQFVEHWKASIFLILIISVGWGFVVAFINQIFDRFNSGNYTALFSSFSANSCYKLDKVRHDVIASLDSDNKLPFSKECDIDRIKDYHLYEILGNTTIFPTLGNVISFNDKANHSYTLASTLLINLGFFFFFTNSIESDLINKIFIFIVIFITLCIGTIFVARRHYRERNIRLYINYLMETKNIEKKEKIFEGESNE